MRMIRTVLALLSLPAVAAAELQLPVTYLRVATPLPPVLSNLDPVPEDLGIAGAQLGLSDNLTTGRFMGHDFSLNVVEVPEGSNPIFAAREALQVTPYLILDAPAEVLLDIADLREAKGAVLFNASAGDKRLRAEDCRANVFHSVPSENMRSDALMQFLQSRRWTDLVLVSGDKPQDVAFAAALKDSARKFGLEIRAEKSWVFDADMRRNASQEVPLFTQDLGDHDVMLVADELGDFGPYIAYNTWHPRPVAGSEGLRPVAWSRVVEQWGAAQLQSRFEEAAGRDMRPRDYAAWAAMRTLGEAVTRTNSSEPATLRDFILSDAFELAGFKGRPMSYRRWNGQLRQPIPVVTDRAVVATAPLEGFLHQHSELDTLGLDAPESACTAYPEN